MEGNDHDVKAVIFDFGGVITETSGGPIIYRGIAERIGETYEHTRHVIRPILKSYEAGSGSLDVFFQTLAKALKNIINWKELRKVYIESYKRRSRINEEVMDIARELKENGYMISIFSNVISPIGEFNKQRGAYEIFDPVILSYEIGVGKPRRRAYEIMLKRVGLPASMCVFVDDHEENLDPARELGMNTIFMKNAEQLRGELREYGVKI